MPEHEWTTLSGGRVKEGFERRRLTYPAELELLLRLAGLEAVHRWGDLQRNEFSDPRKHEYIYLTRKARGPVYKAVAATAETPEVQT